MVPRIGVACKLAVALGVSKDAVHRVWKEAGLKPHRLQRYMASDDPEFEAKAADIIGLYLRPPHHAARVSGAEPASPLSLHAHLLLLAQPGPDLVRQNRM
jgi:hypothetical protein